MSERMTDNDISEIEARIIKPGSSLLLCASERGRLLQALKAERKCVEELQAENASKQAKIDRLMWEYCPDEMTEDQISEWEKHQAPVEESS